MRSSIERGASFLRSRVDFCVGIAFVIIGAVYYGLSFTQTRGISDWSLSPGFFPRLSAGFIMGLGLLLAVLSLASERKEDPSDSQKVPWRVLLYVIVTIAIMFFYVFLIEWLGFILATTLASGGLMILLGSRRWIWIILISIAFPALIYLFALKVMFVLFPAGKLFE
jgi:putative tricarboxylic transport membrane protein